MLDSFECGGLWWLPENLENKIHGKLSYDPRIRSILSLDGAFNEGSDEGDFYKIILGFSSDGKKITLNKCFRSNLQTSIPGYTTSEYIVAVFLCWIPFY